MFFQTSFRLVLSIGLLGLVFLCTACTTQSPPVVVEQQSAVAQQPDVAQELDGDTLKLAWTYQTGGPINYSAMPVRDVVVVAPVGGPLLALEVSTGNLRWQYNPPGKLWERSYASDGERVFVGREGGRLVALNVDDGQIAWQKELGIEVQIAPIVVDTTLYVPTTFVGPGLKAKPDGRAKVYALSTTNGTEAWSFETNNYILQSPFYHNEVLYAAGSYHDPTIEVDEGGPMRLYALSAQDGSPLWTYESEDGFVKALYATDRAVAYIAYQDFTNGVDAQKGTLLWRKETGNWVPSLSGMGDTVYFGSANTVVHALDMNTGDLIWQYNIGGDSFNYMLGAPVRVLDNLYFLTQQGNIIALNATDGTLQWQIATEITGARDGLSVSGSWVFIGDGEGNVYAYTSPGKVP